MPHEVGFFSFTFYLPVTGAQKTTDLRDQTGRLEGSWQQRGKKYNFVTRTESRWLRCLCVRLCLCGADKAKQIRVL